MPTRSRPGRTEYGPSWPKLLIRTVISRGSRSPGATCHFSSVPGRKFSTTTSAVDARRRKRSWPSARRRSSVTLLRPRPSTAQNSEYPGESGSSVGTNGPISRMKSPVRGCSILTTSAPISPRSPAQNGAAMRVPMSSTRSPSSGPLIEDSGVEFAPQAWKFDARVRWGSLVAPLFGLHRVHAALLARLHRPERGRGVADELVDHEVVTPRLALALQVDHPVDRVLDRLRGHRWDQGDLAGHLGRRGRQIGTRNDFVDEAETLGVVRFDGLGTEQELLGLAWAQLPRLDQQLDARAGHAQHRVGELRVVGGDDEVAHAREHEAGRGTSTLHGRDRRLAEVADPDAAVEVHDLLVSELAFRGVAHRGPRVVAREDLLEVVTGREVLAFGGEHHHPHVVVVVGEVERRIELVEQARVLRVRGLGPVQRDRADRSLDVVPDRLEVVSHALLTGQPTSHLTCSSARNVLTAARGAGRAPAHRPRCVGSRWCPPRSLTPGSRARSAATRRHRGSPSRRARGAPRDRAPP